MPLAIDAALRLGAAWGAPNAARPYTAVVDYPREEHNYHRALISARQWTGMMVKTQKIDLVLIEAAMPKVDRDHSYYTAFLLISLQAVIREAACSAGARVEPISCKTWRAHFIGNGNLDGETSKKLAMQRCDQLGYTYQDHNAAEAAGLWDYGVWTYCKRSSLLAGVA